MSTAANYDHGIRLVPICGPGGAILYEAEAASATRPTRASRPQPYDGRDLLTRWRRRSVQARTNAREREAGENLRDAIELSQPSLPGMPRSGGHVAPLDRAALSERQLKGCWCVRRAGRARQRHGPSGTVDRPRPRDDPGLRGRCACTAYDRYRVLRRGLGELADHYRLAVPRVA